jgi:hypothetical protein
MTHAFRPIPGARPLIGVPLLALCLGSAAPLAGQMHGAHGGGEPVATAGRLQVLHEHDREDIVALLGPIALPDTGNTMRLTPAAAITVPVDGWVTRFRARVVDERGMELPSEVLHHINVVRPDRRELFMPVMQRLAAAGQETGEIRVPVPFGVPVSRGDTLLVAAMVHNPTGRPLRLTIEARLHYETPKWLDRFDVEPFYLDVRPPPATASFDLPPGVSTFSWEGSPAIDAQVLGMGGHMHRYAKELRLEEVGPEGETKVLWSVRPELQPGGDIAAIPRCTFLHRFGLPLYKDRTYRLVAVYDNPTKTVIPGGGMAEIAGVVRPGAEWPSADAADPTFRSDYRAFTRNNPALRDRVVSSGEQVGAVAGDPRTPDGHRPPDGHQARSDGTG